MADRVDQDGELDRLTGRRNECVRRTDGVIDEQIDPDRRVTAEFRCDPPLTIVSGQVGYR
jgi:hypothetical protein